MAALANRRIRSTLTLEPVLADVETLNQWALEGRLEVTKLSFAALGAVRNAYGLLYSGGAMGIGCGPLVVSRPGRIRDELDTGLIASPGEYTTACLLFRLYLKKSPRIRHMVFSEIMPSVMRGESDFGLVIHEGRFSYGQLGLTAILDLGEWWQEQTDCLLPLGGIAVRRDLGPEIAATVDEAIRESLALGDKNSPATMDYVLSHAQELDVALVLQHIDLYVNRFSFDIGDEGRRAVEVLFQKAENAGIIERSSLPLMAYEGSSSS